MSGPILAYTAAACSVAKFGSQNWEQKGPTVGKTLSLPWEKKSTPSRSCKKKKETNNNNNKVSGLLHANFSAIEEQKQKEQQPGSLDPVLFAFLHAADKGITQWTKPGRLTQFSTADIDMIVCLRRLQKQLLSSINHSSPSLFVIKRDCCFESLRDDCVSVIQW